MGSQSPSKPHPPSKSLRSGSLVPPRPASPTNPNKLLDANANPDSSPAVATPSSSSSGDSFVHDPEVVDSEFLSREEVLRRRLRRLKRLESCYRDQYWALAEEVRNKHREYYWNYGLNPVQEERRAGSEGNSAAGSAVGEEGDGENGAVVKCERSRCAFAGCKSMAMPLTRFCHPHILSDRNQTLYKACNYVVKSGQTGPIIYGKAIRTGPIICGKPILRATVPSLCSVHFQKTQKHISQALKKAGLNTNPSSKPAPKFHVIIAEYLHQIQNMRREAPNAIVENIEEMDRNVS